MNFSLSAMLNYFLFIGLGFFLALFITKKRKKSKVKANPVVNKKTSDSKESYNTKIGKKPSFISNRLIRLVLLVLYLIIFFIFFKYNSFSFYQLIAFISSFLIFLAFFRLKKIIGTLFILLIIALIILVVMFNRSMYLLFHEETVGKIKIVEVKPTYLKLRVVKIEGNLVTKVYKSVKVEGSQFGVYCYQIYYKKWLSFIGFEHKFHWSAVMGLKFSELERGRAKAKVDIYVLNPENFIKNDKLWRKLEKRELILPGIRSVQRIFVIKTPVKGAVYKLIKHRTGQVSLERDE